MYAFGVLAVEPGGSRRREMLRTSGPDLAAMIGAVDPFQRYAALRVLGRVFERRLQDDPVDESVGDAVIGVLNDRNKDMQSAAMQALGAMRYERGVQGLMDLFQSTTARATWPPRRWTQSPASRILRACRCWPRSWLRRTRG